MLTFFTFCLLYNSQRFSIEIYQNIYYIFNTVQKITNIFHKKRLTLWSHSEMNDKSLNKQFLILRDCYKYQNNWLFVVGRDQEICIIFEIVQNKCMYRIMIGSPRTASSKNPIVNGQKIVRKSTVNEKEILEERKEISSTKRTPQCSQRAKQRS